MIDDNLVRTLFQPIVHLPTAAVVGFEALSRGPVGSALESPDDLFAAAREIGRLPELDWLCRTRALRAVALSELPASLTWFLNLEPAATDVECPAHLRAAWRDDVARLRVVLEVVERDIETHVPGLVRLGARARAYGFGVALDDVGVELASLSLLPTLRPDVVKLDMSLLRDPPTVGSRHAIEVVREYAARTGAVVVAEGVESPAQAELAGTLGAGYAQGFLFGRPAPLPDTVDGVGPPIPLLPRASAGRTSRAE